MSCPPDCPTPNGSLCTDPAEMPDVACAVDSQVEQIIDWVGMEKVEIPLIWAVDGRQSLVPAEADLMVRLDDPNAKGIHMSRLYVKAEETLTNLPLSPTMVANLLKDLQESQGGISSEAKLRLRFQIPVKRNALISEHSGWRYYPIEIEATTINGQLQIDFSSQVTYSSTCPCSAALSRQLIQQGFAEQFSSKDLNFDDVMAWLGSEDGIRATPHSQRSHGNFKVRLSDNASHFYFIELIDAIEAALQTPVQTAVKREDEQEFARLNGSNTMFCEDASRKVAQVLNQWDDIVDYHVHIEHFESLHAHNAVAYITKGVAGGF